MASGEPFSRLMECVRKKLEGCHNKLKSIAKNPTLRPSKINNLFLIPVRANFLFPSGYILCIVVEYLISDNNPKRVYIVGIVFQKVSYCYYCTMTLFYTQYNSNFHIL